MVWWSVPNAEYMYRISMAFFFFKEKNSKKDYLLFNFGNSRILKKKNTMQAFNFLSLDPWFWYNRKIIITARYISYTRTI